MKKLTQYSVRALGVLCLVFAFSIAAYAVCSPFNGNSTDNTIIVSVLPGGDCDDTEPMLIDHSAGASQTVDLGCGCSDITGIKINGGSLLTPGFSGIHGSWNVTVTTSDYYIVEN